MTWREAFWELLEFEQPTELTNYGRTEKPLVALGLVPTWRGRVWRDESHAVRPESAS